MPEDPRRIALVGTVNRDTISAADGTQIESYGGLLYSMLPLAEIASLDTEIYPVCNVGRDMESVVRDRLSPYPAIRFDGIRFVPEKNPHCFLDYDAEGNKQETLQGGVPLLDFERFGRFLDCDAICFNFITGHELPLAVLQQVRRASEALVCMDVHSLTLGMDENRRRFWRVPPNWEAWLGCADVVQMNEREGALLAGEALADDAAVHRFGEKVLSLGPDALLITRGERGSYMISRNPERNAEIQHFPACPAGQPQDETGCGDAFLMGFTLRYLQSGDFAEASRFANRVAGINCCLRGIEGVTQIGAYLGSEARFDAPPSQEG